MLPGARVVKGLKHLNANTVPEPEVSGGKRVQFEAGDDADPKREVAQMLEFMGYFPVSIGSLASGGRLLELPIGSLAAMNWIKI